MRVNAEAAHLAETQPKVLDHPEVIRAMEQELTALLVCCLQTSEVRIGTASTRGNADIAVRFEAVLAANPRRMISPAEWRDATGTLEHAMRQGCKDVPGVTPRQYMRLRRLMLVRHAIMHADPAAVRLGELARQGGFANYRNFAMICRCAFGEPPSGTLRRGSTLL